MPKIIPTLSKIWLKVLDIENNRVTKMELEIYVIYATIDL